MRQLNLKAFVGFLGIICLKFKFNQARQLPQEALLVQQLQTNYHHLPAQHEQYRVQLKEDFAAQELAELGHEFNAAHGAFNYVTQDDSQPDYQQIAQHYEDARKHRYFSDLHLKQLAESAKDPNNLRNGIYHEGAVTYDLGWPNYKILNPYEPPEIITPNHPQYHEHMNYIKQSNNFTIEDFAITPMPEMNSIPETTTLQKTTASATGNAEKEYSKTTTMCAEPETTTPASTLTETLATTTAAAGIANTESPAPEHEPVNNDLQKYLSRTKEKALKNASHTISVPSQDLKIVFLKSKADSTNKQNHIPTKPTKPRKVYYLPRQQKQHFSEEPLQQTTATLSLQPFETYSKSANNLRKQAVLLPTADHVASINRAYKLRHRVPMPLLYEQPVPSFYSPSTSQDNSASQEELFKPDRLNRSPPEESSIETSSPASTECPEITTSFTFLTKSEDYEEAGVKES